MSKITDAIHRAQADRYMWLNPNSSRLEPVVTARQPLSHGSIVVETPPTARTAAAEPSATTTGGIASPAQPTEAARVATAPGAAGTPESWEEAIALVTKQLEACEQQLAKHHGEQVRVQAKIRAAEQLLAEVEREQTGLRAAQEQAVEQAAAVERTRTVWIRQLEALRECAVLSHACRVAEQELHTNTTLITRTTQSQQQITGELAHYQQRGESLRQQVEQLRFKLANALASTGTTEKNDSSDGKA